MSTRETIRQMLEPGLKLDPGRWGNPGNASTQPHLAQEAGESGEGMGEHLVAHVHVSLSAAYFFAGHRAAEHFRTYRPAREFEILGQ